MNLLFMVLFVLPATVRTIAMGDPTYILIWIKGWLKSFHVFFKIGVSAKWSVAHNKAIMRYISSGGIVVGSEWIYVVPSVMKFTKHIPGGETVTRQSLGRLALAFSFGVNYMRQMTWEALSNQPAHHRKCR